MIAGPYPEENRIVRSWPAAQTGESYYQTEDGRVWKTTFHTETITGVSYGSIEGDRMVSPPRSRSVTFYPRPTLNLKPIPVEYPEVAKALPVKPERPQRRGQGVKFVGGGPMRRRWR